MIIDRIENAPLYFGLGERFEKALRALMEEYAGEVPAPGKRVVLEENNLYYSVSLNNNKTPDDDYYEAHVKFADIQFVLDGSEYMGWANIRDLRPRESYKADADIAWYSGKGTMQYFTRGYFAIFFPEDAHMPCRTNGSTPSQSIKIVAKVRLAD